MFDDRYVKSDAPRGAAARDAPPVLDTRIGVFEQMGTGNALGVQVREAALHATRFRRPEGSEGRRALNEARLDAVRAVLTALRNRPLERAAAEGAARGMADGAQARPGRPGA